MATYLLGIVIIGVFVGLVSGMFGLGGGGVIVPALLPLLPLIGVPESKLMFMAMGTAFATMIISTVVTAFYHYRNHNIDFYRVKLFLFPLLLSVLVTSRIVTSINQNYLKLFFSLFLVYFGFKMLNQSKHSSSRVNPKMPYAKLKHGLAGIGIGLVATLGGVSGAGLIVSFLDKTGLPIKKAIGTAAFCGVFLTIFASIGFIMSGLNATNLPAYSLGFIHLPTVGILSLLSVPTSRWGVKLMLKISDKKMKQYFAWFLILLSVYMMLIAIRSLLV